MDRPENVSDGKAGMNADRKSDGSIEPAKPVNKGGAEPPAERVEGRDPVERNAGEDALRRTPGRNKRKSRGLSGVREAARKDSTLKFTSLMHHIDEGLLMVSFNNLKRNAAVGIDGVTWGDYERNAEANISDLHSRIHRGAYRAKPTRRVWM